MERKSLLRELKDLIPGFSITYQENDDMAIKEGSNMLVEHITAEEFKRRLDSIDQSTASPNKFYSMQDYLPRR
jgi:hypothetical protein